MIEDFHRIKRLPPYVFAEVNALKATARAGGADIIDLGMGNPDMQTPQHIVDKLVETVNKPRVHRYSASKGIPGLRRAQAAYYARRFGVKLDPETQIVATLGSKEGFANMAQAIAAPGDVVLTPNPTYPIHEFGFLISGASVRHLPASNGDEFLAAVSRACKHTVPKPIAMVLSYPSNPTAMTATRDFYAQAVQLAKQEGLIILSDLAYSEIYFDGNPPPSVLEIPGAMELAVEFTSLSKTYSMPGWRMGFAVGNERLISALARVKSYLDYGAFTPVQVAAAPRSTGRRIVLMKCEILISRDVMRWLRVLRAPDGMCRRRPLRCLPGYRCREVQKSWINWVFEVADRKGGCRRFAWRRFR